MQRQRWWLGLTIGAMLWSLSAVQVGASSHGSFEVTVTIERVRMLDDAEGVFGGAEDLYAIVRIDGFEFPGTDDVPDDDDISPNWEFTRTVAESRSPVPVSIEIWDEDGALRFDDDHIDVSPASGRNLDLSVTLVPCAVGGEVTGDCGATIVSAGTEDDRAELSFRIDVEEPASAPGLRVRCMHSPVWPQAGETVTITAEALDGALATRVADDIEIWVDDRSGPALTGAGSGLDTTAGPFTTGSFAYGCRVQDDGVTVFSGWRSVQVGPPSGRPVPVSFTGPAQNRIDILLVPDQDDYTGAADPAWLSDAESIVRDAYYAEDAFLSRQKNLNFWLAQDMGDVDPNPAPDGICPIITVPVGFDSDYAFADSAGIFHTDSLRDCAGGRRFSSEPTSLRVVLHETGHAPFGLADEYCCDGGYWQPDPNPNVYSSQQNCIDDTSDVGRTAGDCRSWTSDGGAVFWTSDPASDDLMVDNRSPNALDARRINWLFDRCASPGVDC